jgi:hypothetical protein
LEGPLAGCDVLISTISDFSPAYTEVHRKLLSACQASRRCKRFIPAEFAVNIEDFPDQPGFYYGPHEPVREMLRNQNDVEWTLVCIGWLADYFVPAKNRYIKDIGEYHPLDWAEGKITIPGTGDEPVDYTWARDVVKALALLIEAQRGSWEPYTFISGERSCWNDALKLVRERYHPDVDVQHLSLHTVAERLKTAKDEDALILADYHLLSLSGACGNPSVKVAAHRRKFFSDLHFRTLREGLDQFDKDTDAIL